jgi:hypothetical protein
MAYLPRTEKHFPKLVSVQHFPEPVLLQSLSANGGVSQDHYDG